MLAPRFILLLCLVILAGLNGTLSSVADNHVSVQSAIPYKLDTPLLPNALMLHPDVISGGLPEGDLAFKALAERGIKTIISVDGMKPDIETAKRFGMRYVHLPHGYDGIPATRVQELAKAVLELPRPIYIHCHHGKHRSPAAATVACVAAGLVEQDDAQAVLLIAGTNKNYRGLFQSVQRAKPIPRSQLHALRVDFKEVAEVPPVAEAMVELGRRLENIKLIEDAGFNTPKHHPDLDPSHEALLLREHFAELRRTGQVATKATDYRQILLESERLAKTLEEMLKHRRASSFDSPAASKMIERISAKCSNCHARYRDNPLEK